MKIGNEPNVHAGLIFNVNPHKTVAPRKRSQAAVVWAMRRRWDDGSECKTNPRFIAAARELRDRWLEKVNEDPAALLSQGKYEVSRQLQGPTTESRQTPLLAAA